MLAVFQQFKRFHIRTTSDFRLSLEKIDSNMLQNENSLSQHCQLLKNLSIRVQINSSKRDRLTLLGSLLNPS